MHFTGTYTLLASREDVWSALHDDLVLRRIIPGCERLSPVGGGRYAATLAARVGRLADTYQGTFNVEDLRAVSELAVAVTGRGRFGSLVLDLRVVLTAGARPGTSLLRYDASAHVGGLVSRLGRGPLTVAGGHLTSCFFNELERVLRSTAPPARLAVAG